MGCDSYMPLCIWGALACSKDRFGRNFHSLKMLVFLLSSRTSKIFHDGAVHVEFFLSILLDEIEERS
jgi:hypothetical protein